MLKPRTMLVASAGLSLAMGAYTVFAPSGLARLRERQRENDALRAQVDKSKRDNTALIEQVALLKAENVGDNAIPPALLTQRRDAVLEHAARTTLGYVHQADVAFDGLPVLPEERATSP